MMSTADSQLLVISSSVIEDFYHKTLGKDVTEKRLLNLSRGITVLVGLMGFVIAYTSEEIIYDLVSYAWAGLGSSFGPALLMVLYWKKITRKGVLAGMLTGTITTVVWSNIDVLNESLNVKFTSFVFAFAAVILVSLITRKSSNA